MPAPSHDEPTLQAPAAGIAGERRQAHEVRSRFEQACALVAPFFDPAARWGCRPMHHLAMRALREHFTDLSPAELAIMLAGIEKLHARGRTPAPEDTTPIGAGLRRPGSC